MIVRNKQGMLFLVERRDYNTDIEYYNRIRIYCLGLYLDHPMYPRIIIYIHKSPL